MLKWEEHEQRNPFVEVEGDPLERKSHKNHSYKPEPIGALFGNALTEASVERSD